MRTQEKFAKAYQNAMALALAHSKSFWVVPTADNYEVSVFKPSTGLPHGTTWLEVTYQEALIHKARRFAISAHGDQMYGDNPFIYHLDKVVGLLEPYGVQAKVMGYLHDVLEDTAVSLNEIEREFGEFVCSCLSILTDEPGVNRAERKAKTYSKMAKVNGPELLALVVKVADRLANTLACIEGRKTDLLNMYRSEFNAFYWACHRAGLCEDLWKDLKACTFRDVAIHDGQ